MEFDALKCSLIGKPGIHCLQCDVCLMSRLQLVFDHIEYQCCCQIDLIICNDIYTVRFFYLLL